MVELNEGFFLNDVTYDEMTGLSNKVRAARRKARCL